MTTILGINAVFHDPAAALVVDGETVAAAEEERFSRRKHGKEPVPFSAWELPVEAMRWCLARAGLEAGDVDAVAYSYDPDLAPASSQPGAGAAITDDEWEPLRTLYVRRVPQFLATALPGLRPGAVSYVAHHVAHAASACVAAPDESSAVLVLDGRGEAASHLGGRWRDGRLDVLAGQRLPHSLGLLYEEVTAHLGFRRASDEYKVMALAAYGDPGRFGPTSATTSGPPATAASRSTRSSSGPCYPPALRGRPGGTCTPTWPRPSRCGWRRSSSTSAAGCTSARGNGRSRSPAAWRSTAWPTAGSPPRARSSESGCSLRPATPAPRSAPRSALATARARPAPLHHCGARPGMGRGRGRGGAQGRRAALRAVHDPNDLAERVAAALDAGASSAGSRGVASTAHAPSGTAACCATPAAPRTSPA